MRRPFRSLIVLSSVAALAVVTLVTGESAVSAATTPIAEVAPYFETTAVNAANLNTAVTQHGLKSFTAAFVLGKGCTPTWDDYSKITGKDARSVYVTKATAAGATPILSFGGQAGNDLAKTCTNVTSLVKAYQSLITMFGVTKLDFDVEGVGPVNDTATNTRRYKALKTLEAQYPKLEVSFTLAVTQSGIDGNQADGNGIALLQLAKSQGVRVDVVNLMAMDYGSAVSNMGATAVTVAKGALKQLKAIWPSDTYANIGITPMIGNNDSPNETFTYANAQTVLKFAHANGVHRLAFWSMNRDQACTPTDTTCSGLSQSPLDYTDAFLG